MAVPFRPRANTPARLRGTTPAHLRGATTTTPPPPPPGFLIDVENIATQVFPDLLVRVAFFSDPLDNVPQWTELTSVCRGCNINRGRSFELDAVQAGTATFTFNNFDRSLDPTYQDGPYYGLLTSRRLIQVCGVWGDVIYPRFTGFVDSWPQYAEASAKNAVTTTVTATDLFGWLSRNQLRPEAPGITNDPVYGLTNNCVTGGQLSFPAVESCGSRVNSILDLWPLPPFMRAVDDGNTLLVADTDVSSSETSLNYLQRITNSETGRLFVSNGGALQFQGRNHWQTATSQSQSQLVLSDQVKPSYTSVNIDPADERYIRNRIVRARQDMDTPIVAQDPASIRANGAIEDSRTDLLTASRTDFRNQTAWLLAKYANPQPRFSSVTIKPQNAPDLLFPPVLKMDLGDRLTLAYTPSDIGDPMVGNYSIEQISESWAAKQCSVSYQLSPADTTVY